MGDHGWFTEPRKIRRSTNWIKALSKLSPIEIQENKKEVKKKMLEIHLKNRKV